MQGKTVRIWEKFKTKNLFEINRKIMLPILKRIFQSKPKFFRNTFGNGKSQTGRIWIISYFLEPFKDIFVL